MDFWIQRIILYGQMFFKIVIIFSISFYLADRKYSGSINFEPPKVYHCKKEKALNKFFYEFHFI